jgi:hypothetical protein
MRTISTLIRTARLDASASSLSAFRFAGLAGGLLFPLLMAAPVIADEGEQESLASPVAVPAETETPVELSAFESAEPLSESELTEQRAAANIEIDNITINTSDQNGEVGGNTATGNRTGNNTIGDNAFTGTDGFITSIQNTGNNVLIQNSTVINVSLEQ